ncbi:MAG: hypothetical protein K2X93_00500 [Candidatus Obscuribacterales bacterium]|nr:hypothetical protein [Candidatus Obscuribacterales bacterium]
MQTWHREVFNHCRKVVAYLIDKHAPHKDVNGLQLTRTVSSLFSGFFSGKKPSAKRNLESMSIGWLKAAAKGKIDNARMAMFQFLLFR